MVSASQANLDVLLIYVQSTRDSCKKILLDQVQPPWIHLHAILHQRNRQAFFCKFSWRGLLASRNKVKNTHSICFPFRMAKNERAFQLALGQSQLSVAASPKVMVLPLPRQGEPLHP